MIQLRWKDEQEWKDAPWLHSVEQAEEEFTNSRNWARAVNHNYPPLCGVEFRVRPYFTMDAHQKVLP
jgi:hypothetical protein